MYRDDHEAALARVRVLERDLARADAELRRLRSCPPASVSTASSSRSVVPVVCVLGGVGAIVVSMLANCRTHRDSHVVGTVSSRADDSDRVVAEGISRATSLAPGAKLVAIDAAGVRSDGSLDPDYGEVAVELVRDNGPDPGAIVDSTTPIGAPQPEHLYLQHDCIRFVYRRGRWQDELGITIDIERLHSCMHTFETKPAVHQRCSLLYVWQRVRKVAPAEALAHIALDAAGWTFAIDDPRFRIARHVADACDE